MDVCLLWTGRTLAEQISRFCIAQRQNAVLGMRKNRISGFLHWGLNQFPGGMNPMRERVARTIRESVRIFRVEILS